MLSQMQYAYCRYPNEIIDVNIASVDIISNEIQADYLGIRATSILMRKESIKTRRKTRPAKNQ
jgi:hypothetical protein